MSRIEVRRKVPPRMGSESWRSKRLVSLIDGAAAGVDASRGGGGGGGGGIAGGGGAGGGVLPPQGSQEER